MTTATNSASKLNRVQALISNLRKENTDLKSANKDLKKDNAQLNENNIKLIDKDNKLCEENKKLNTSSNSNNKIISEANQKANVSLENFGVKFERIKTLRNKMNKIVTVNEELKGVMMA
ncbi:16831_t:CDS:1 [Cetraspora pellucida]|uniref:16831_t:CDS:1 n=1 Tax=Cetraspora pellucida TaxID=1433469 RepID=A0A9N9D482_9GLOM|nr:16831_t:CDS:1 [Cetraspora pellucida]